MLLTYVDETLNEIRNAYKKTHLKEIQCMYQPIPAIFEQCVNLCLAEELLNSTATLLGLNKGVNFV
jgi:hypothetical protein